MVEKYKCDKCDKFTVLSERIIESGRAILSDGDNGKKYVSITCYGGCDNVFDIERTELPKYICPACDVVHVDNGSNKLMRFFLSGEIALGEVDCDCGMTFNIPVQDKTLLELRIQKAIKTPR